MMHGKNIRKLSRQRHHYRALMRNLALALFQNERITTTHIKAKECRRFIEKIITLGKKGGLHNRRQAFSLMGNITVTNEDGQRVDVLDKVFGELAERYKNRSGGYTRIYRLARDRAGDAAPMAILELVDAPASALFKGKDEAEEAAPKKKAKKKVEEAPAEEEKKASNA